MTAPRPGVLMVTGAYYPELSGAGLQCRALVQRLKGQVDFTILTTTTDRALPPIEVQDGVPVHRVFVDPGSRWSKAAAAARMTRVFIRVSRRFSILHLHGFSQKSLLLVWLALAAGKRVAIKLTSVGDDDPEAIARRSRLASWCYRRAAMFFAVSPGFASPYRAAGLDPARLRTIPNGVDLQRFRPASLAEREAIRRELGLPAGPIVLFVGFFSREKRPDRLLAAWVSVRALAAESSLVFVGATRSRYFEVDERLADEMRRRVESLGLASHVRFVESTIEIERFHRAADIFVLPSVREGLPNALLEAMACGAACLATRLPGVTDGVIEHERNGLLVPPDDARALEDGLRRLFDDPACRARLGAEARRTIETRYSLDDAARQYLDAYHDLQSGHTCAA